MTDPRACRRCGGTYSEHFFASIGTRVRDASLTSRHRSAVCRGCRDTERDQKKAKNRFPQKARDTIRRHARRFMAAGVIKAERDLSERFGWDAAKLAHDAEHAYQNGCPYCAAAFKGMGHGLADIQLDIVDPKRPPFYNLNTRWACQTCNRRKSNTPPEVFGELMAAYRQWAELQKKREAGDGFSDLPLFRSYG